MNFSIPENSTDIFDPHSYHLQTIDLNSTNTEDVYGKLMNFYQFLTPYYYALFGMTIIFFLLLLYLIFFQTPAEIKSSKWFLLKLIVSNFLTVTVFFLWQPIPLFPYLGAFSYGVFKHIGKFGNVIALILVSISLSCLVLSIIETMAQKVVIFMPSGPIADFFKQTKKLVIFFGLVNTVNIIVLTGSIWMAATIDPDYEQFLGLKEPQGNMYTTFLDQAMKKQGSAFIINVQNNPWAYFFVIWVLSVNSLALSAVVFLYIKLRNAFGETSDIVTKKTQEMQKNLLNTLNFLSRIYFFFLFLPILMTFLSILDVIQSLYIGLVSFNLIPFHAILIYIFMIVNMRPYRNFLFKIVRSAIRIIGADTTNKTDENGKVIKGLDKKTQALGSKNTRKEAWD